MDSGLAHLRNDIFLKLNSKTFYFLGLPYDFETQQIWNNGIMVLFYNINAMVKFTLNYTKIQNFDDIMSNPPAVDHACEKNR